MRSTFWDDLTPEDWKAGKPTMGKVRPYEPDPAESEQPTDLATFNFKLVKVAVDPLKSGWGRYTISIPTSVREMYANDIVYGEDWASLLRDFDKRPLMSKKT